jgi:hypothetical protein
MSNHYRGPSIDASYQASIHLAEGFQRRRLKCEKLTDDRRRTTDAKWWQKLTLPLARWAKNTSHVTKVLNKRTLKGNHNAYLLLFFRGRGCCVVGGGITSIIHYSFVLISTQNITKQFMYLFSHTICKFVCFKW